MSIVKNIDISIKDGVSVPSSKLYFYKGDEGIILPISIINLEYSIVKTATVLNLDGVSSVEILISKPNKKTACIKNVIVSNGKINFNITKELTDIVGEYMFQIRLVDENNSKMTIPPCKYDVFEPIAIYS